MPRLADIAAFCDALLATPTLPDSSRAVNGIQVDTDADILAVTAAVDARERTILRTRDAGANLLIAHHGLFWSGLQPMRDAQRRRFAALLAAGIGVYAAHIPLDAHPEIGNNILLARALELEATGGFGRYEGIEIGVMGSADLPTADLAARCRAYAARYDGGIVVSPMAEGRRTRRWAIITGAGASNDTIAEAAERGVDTLIVGEGPHHTAITAEESGVVVIYAGHYATETLGVQALAERVSQEFGIPWSFLHEPTGL